MHRPGEWPKIDVLAVSQRRVPCPMSIPPLPIRTTRSSNS
jgi:hypothetical protein